MTLFVFFTIEWLFRTSVMIVSYHIRPIHVFHAKNIYELRFSAVTEMTQSYSRTKHNHPIRSNPQSKFTTFPISLSCISHIFICKFQHNKPLKHDSSVFLQKISDPLSSTTNRDNTIQGGGHCHETHNNVYFASRPPPSSQIYNFLSSYVKIYVNEENS